MITIQSFSYTKQAEMLCRECGSFDLKTFRARPYYVEVEGDWITHEFGLLTVRI